VCHLGPDMRILHFADAHIDMANYGRHDPQSGLPLRVLDFLKSLDTIVDTAIREKVDLVLFAGDTYKDRSPAPTFQREWGKRIMRLSRAGLKTLLLLGNHDLSPAQGRAHAIQEFDTLQVPHVRVLDKPAFLGVDDLGLPVQIVALPWIARSGLVAALGISAADPKEVFEQIEQRVSDLILGWLSQSNPGVPVILAAHASVQGAKYGSEQTVMLGADLVLPGSLVRDKRWDYVALGHIHRPQDLNEGLQPPVVYPGSIERVDFGEVNDEKFFVIADVEKGKTQVEWRKLENIRPFFDCHVQLESSEKVTEAMKSALPRQKMLKDAIVRLTVSYPREWETMIDESSLREHTKSAFEFHFIRRPQINARIRLPKEQAVSSLSPLDLLDVYWRTLHTDEKEIKELDRLAQKIIAGEQEGE